MRIAVLFHGIVGGIDGKNGYGEPINIKHCSKFWEKNVYEGLEYDVFVHSWSKEHEQLILDAYKPTEYIIEEQKTFGFNIPEETKHHDNNYSMLYKNISRYTSAHIVYQIMLEYQRKFGIEYDFCILSRMDLIFFNKLILNNIEKNNIYICNNPFPNWQDHNTYNIIWEPFFIMDTETMGEFCNLIIDLNNKKFINTASSPHSLPVSKIRDMGYINKIKPICERWIDMDIYRFIFLDNPNDGRDEIYNNGVNAKRMFQKLKEWQHQEHTSKINTQSNNIIISIKNI